MASRELLTRSEEGLVNALVDLSKEQVSLPPRFKASLRDRLLAEAQAIEAQEADAFHAALENGSATGDLAALAGFAKALAPATPMRAPDTLRTNLRSTLTQPTVAPPVADVVSFEAARTRRAVLATRLTRRLAIAAAISAMMVSTSAFALVASANDTPVDSLYGLKKFRERVQTWFISGTDEGVRRLAFADARMDEAEVMLARDVIAVAPYEVVLDDLKIQVTLASSLIIEGKRNGDPAADEALPKLAEFLTDGRDRLESLEPNLPEGTSGVVDDVLATFDTVVEGTDPILDLCLLCGPKDTPGSGSPDPSGSGGEQPSGDGSSNGDDDTILPRPDPDRDQGDDDEPGPVDELPDEPIPTPLPEPDRIPDLPGRIDDELEDIVSSLTTDLVGAF